MLAEASLEVVRANKLEASYLRPVAFFDAATLSVWTKECPVTVAIAAVPDRQVPRERRRRRARHRLADPEVRQQRHPGVGEGLRPVHQLGARGERRAAARVRRSAAAQFAGAGRRRIGRKPVRREGRRHRHQRQGCEHPDGRHPGVGPRDREDLGIEARVAPISVEDVLGADELFFTGTAVEVTAIREVDGRVIGGGKPGAVTRRIQETFNQAVRGQLPQYRRWLSFVRQRCASESGEPESRSVSLCRPASRLSAAQLALGAAAAPTPPAAARPRPPPMTNLQILSKDMPRPQVIARCRRSPRARGPVQLLPRRRKGAAAATTWRRTRSRPKKAARGMMLLAREINTKLPDAVGKAADATTRVGCATCHRGVPIPKQIDRHRHRRGGHRRRGGGHREVQGAAREVLRRPELRLQRDGAAADRAARQHGGKAGRCARLPAGEPGVLPEVGRARIC